MVLTQIKENYLYNILFLITYSNSDSNIHAQIYEFLKSSICHFILKDVLFWWG